VKTSWIQEVLDLPLGASLRITDGPGTRVCVSTGLVWLTEEGVAEDQFISAGQTYAIQGVGVVILSAESDARLQLIVH
jgi:Protein of unknown function (DUF2917)